MLKRIGLGIFMLTVSNLLISTINFIVLELYQANDNSTMINNVTHYKLNCAFSESLWFVLTLINDIGVLITTTTTFEFCMAQAPCQVRGLVSAMLLASCGIVGVPSALLHLFFKHNHFVDMFFSLLMLGTFIAFLLVSKWYKLRKRNEIIPYHMFAENHFERNYERDREWYRQHGYPDWKLWCM